MGLCENNIFTNPKGWTHKAVGTPLRYRLGQVSSVMLGLIISACVLIQRDFSTLQYIVTGIAVFAAATYQPLGLLRVLRHFVRELEKTESDDEGTT